MKHRLILAITCIFMVFFLAAEMPLVVSAKNSKSTEDSDDSEDEEAAKKEAQKKEREAQKKASSSAIIEKMQENKDAINDAENSKNNLNAGMEQAKAIVAALASQKDDLEEYVTELDDNLTQMQDDLDDLNTQIDDKLDEIEKTKGELEEAKDLEAEQYLAMKTRIKFMYSSKSSTILDILLNAEGIKDLLNKAEYIEKVTEYDRDQLDKLMEAKLLVAQKQSQLEAENKDLNDKKQEVLEQQESIETLIDAKETEISQYSASIASKEAQITEYENMIAAQDAQIRALEAAIEAEAAALEELAKQQEEEGGESSGLPKYDGGKFTFPAPGYTRVSDDYGNRMHPTLGIEKFHNGIDLAAPNGSPILAAYSGTVVAADYSSTMGNYIMISHGDGVYTIYMHASSLSVSKGESVSKGQRIGSVGSTGRSTGPHLHFSVRVGGNYVSPWNYLK